MVTGRTPQIAERAQQAFDGIPKTLAANKRIAESVDANEDVRFLGVGLVSELLWREVAW